MLFFDQLKKNDTPLQLLALVIFSGLALLLAGLWWVQIVRARDYQSSLETQSYRTIRLPSVRGKIIDRNGQVLAENRATFNISLYLEDLSKAFRKEYQRSKPLATTTNAVPFWKRWLGVGAKARPVKLKPDQLQALEWQARYRVASNVIQELAVKLQSPGLVLDTNEFKRHYESRRALPYPVFKGASPANVARFEEQLSGNVAAELEIQSTRVYPFGATASHVLGYLHRDNSSGEGEEADFSYRLPDFRGVVGIEGKFDDDLRGHAGAKYVLVNNLGYRQSESISSPAEAGHNVVLTLDLGLQQAAERSLRSRVGPDAKGAIVVMDVNSGDLLALVSSPAMDPNYFVNSFPNPNEIARWNDAELGTQKNKATYELYQPGSIFKTVVALAALEAGLNRNEKFHVAPNPQDPAHGIIYVGGHPFHDTAPPGDYDFRTALFKSSNVYFITNGLRTGVEKIVALGHRFHFGEKMGIPTWQESDGKFPSLKRVSANWFPGDTANLCIGQGAIAITPMQMTVMTAALANGGNVLRPRLVDRIESQDPASLEPPKIFPRSEVRDHLGVRKSNLDILHEAMLADTEDPNATAYHAFQARARSADATKAMRVCGKTGTAQKKDEHGRTVDHITWFISFAPYGTPRYAVVVMVESGASGGGTCAPVAADVYTALDKFEATRNPRTLAQTH